MPQLTRKQPEWRERFIQLVLLAVHGGVFTVGQPLLLRPCDGRSSRQLLSLLGASDPKSASLRSLSALPFAEAQRLLRALKAELQWLRYASSQSTCVSCPLSPKRRWADASEELSECYQLKLRGAPARTAARDHIERNTFYARRLVGNGKLVLTLRNISASAEGSLQVGSVCHAFFSQLCTLCDVVAESSSYDLSVGDQEWAAAAPSLRSQCKLKKVKTPVKKPVKKVTTAVSRGGFAYGLPGKINITGGIELNFGLNFDRYGSTEGNNKLADMRKYPRHRKLSPSSSDLGQLDGPLANTPDWLERFLAGPDDPRAFAMSRLFRLKTSDDGREATPVVAPCLVRIDPSMVKGAPPSAAFALVYRRIDGAKFIDSRARARAQGSIRRDSASYLILELLDDSMTVVQSSMVMCEGTEPRAIVHNGALWAYTHFERRVTKQRSLLTSQHFEVRLYNAKTQRLTVVKVLDAVPGQVIGKNWSPFSRGGTLYFVYSLFPLHVLAFEETNATLYTIFRAPQLPENAYATAAYRGGTQAVVVSGRYVWGVGHSTVRSTHWQQPYLWCFDIKQMGRGVRKAKLTVHGIGKPASHLIFPVSLVWLGDAQGWAVTGTESDQHWFTRKLLLSKQPLNHYRNFVYALQYEHLLHSTHNMSTLAHIMSTSSYAAHNLSTLAHIMSTASHAAHNLSTMGHNMSTPLRRRG